MSQKQYVIRHKGMPSSTLNGNYANTAGQWYYCERGPEQWGGTWRHQSEIRYLILGPLDKIGDRYNRIATAFYKEGVLEIVELTESMSADFVMARLAH